ncbi:DegT/DnrJ/EryC1/StrS family aminotransferase [Actinomycetospora straminea]|uniref:DegT/DnrJ/EryC1/StrS family aminotransferase n=1 Tax=Actinomycetospora straminea TaxID=663607 RepID=A0ABP9E1D1_9PSEU|nr:DegT/DnrJ/EryC1/StrS family aminotransferase [Actinomycetospora straminea]MDD7931044.1 DegT/DnrJ/EryC1/StrS family aminotransferase [Actinomycetospora straminea]
MTGSVPFLDLPAVTDLLRRELDLTWKSVLEHGIFVGGPEVTRFETEFAQYCDVARCVGVGNGTDALELILAGLDIGAGDEVIVPANTFIASVEAVRARGARPRFVDVLPTTLLIDPDAVLAAIGPRTAAVLAVHLYGQMADMSRLLALADHHGLALVEDAAQAHGARFAGAKPGSGTAAAFSFYPGKNLGALGDGGAVVTRDPGLADRIRRLANHGRSATDRHVHTEAGRNSRLDSLQAGLLSAKLVRLDRDNERRAAAMHRYRAGLPSTAVPVDVDPRAHHVHHLAVVRVPDRDRVVRELDRAEIGWGVHYPVPCHRQPPFADPEADVPVVERAASEILSLPMSPTLTDDDVDLVCDVVKRAQR